MFEKLKTKKVYRASKFHEAPYKIGQLYRVPQGIYESLTRITKMPTFVDGIQHNIGSGIGYSGIVYSGIGYYGI
jgi:hypothetical protein